MAYIRRDSLYTQSRYSPRHPPDLLEPGGPRRMMERQSATHDIDELQASMLRSLASAHRLRILHLIGAQPCEVNEIARARPATGRDLAAPGCDAVGGHGRSHPRRADRPVSPRRSADPGRLRADAGGPRAPVVEAGRPGGRGARTHVSCPPIHRGTSVVSDSLSLVLFSGTDDKLMAAATLAAGAAAMGGTVNVLLMFWALDAFRTD